MNPYPGHGATDSAVSGSGEDPALPPAVSVVMPVLDAAPYIDTSIASILDQTEPDLELVIVDNGSRDGSPERARVWARRDPRVRLVTFPTPLGVSGSSNAAVRAARSDLVARMDADDISHPRRIEMQLEVMRSHPDAVMVATMFVGIDGRGRPVRPRDRSPLLRGGAQVPFPHGSVLFQKRAFDAVGGYSDELSGWGEDKELIRRMAAVGQVMVVPDALYEVRFHTRSVTASARPAQAAAIVALTDAAAARRLPPGRARRRLEGRTDSDRMADVVFLSAAVRLWSGARPGLLRVLVSHRLLTAAPRRVAMAVWAAWGALSPGSLRAVMVAWIRARDRVAALRVPDGRAVSWHFG